MKLQHFRMAVTAVLFLILAFMPAFAEKEGLPVTLRIAAGGKIIQGAAIYGKDRTWVDLDSFRKSASTLGIEESYDTEARLLSLNCGKTPENLPSGGNNHVTVAAGGGILKLEALDVGSRTFIPLEGAKALYGALNISCRMDSESSVMSLNRDDAKAPAMANSLPSDILPKEELDRVKSQAEIQKENVQKYLDGMKEIFDRRKPSPKDIAKFQEALLSIGSGKIKTDDLISLAEKYKGAADELKKLTPPDRETKEAGDMAIGIFNRMKELVETAVELLKLDSGIENPEAFLRFRRLNEEIGEQTAVFDRKIIELRKKYNLKLP